MFLILFLSFKFATMIALYSKDMTLPQTNSTFKIFHMHLSISSVPLVYLSLSTMYGVETEETQQT